MRKRVIVTIRILFVEKEPTTADLLVPSLERKRYAVAVAHTQRQAMIRARASRPDLLIIDVASFGPRGYRVSEAIRDQFQGIAPILLLPEGHDPASSSTEAFMTPPFTSRRLLYRVRKVEDALPCREVKAGDLLLDPETGILHKSGSEVRQLPKETALLALFMRNWGRVLSRQQIMEQVWKTDYLDDTRTLNVHVCWLRAKIEDEPREPSYLRRVGGVGCRLTWLTLAQTWLQGKITYNTLNAASTHSFSYLVVSYQ
jgi:DNA-binding response OmpR family regulator